MEYTNNGYVVFEENTLNSKSQELEEPKIKLVED